MEKLVSVLMLLWSRHETLDSVVGSGENSFFSGALRDLLISVEILLRNIGSFYVHILLVLMIPSSLCRLLGLTESRVMGKYFRESVLRMRILKVSKGWDVAKDAMLVMVRDTAVLSSLLFFISRPPAPEHHLGATAARRATISWCPKLVANDMGVDPSDISENTSTCLSSSMPTISLWPS
jgi:hypothetical protein